MSYLGTPPNEDIVSNVKEYIATAGQTVFEVIYDNYAEVSLNGTQLASSDYSMNNGMSITLVKSASAGDVVQCTGYESFKFNNTVDISTSQTISGTKTFINNPIIPDAIASNEPLSKGQLLTAIKAVDGAGSGLDADLVRGWDGTLVWYSPTLVNSWVSYGSGYAVCQYAKNPMTNEVTIRGLIKGGSNTRRTTIFTLPAGFRPLMGMLQIQAASSGYVRSDVDSNGDVVCTATESHSGNANAWMTLNIKFIAGQ